MLMITKKAYEQVSKWTEPDEYITTEKIWLQCDRLLTKRDKLGTIYYAEYATTICKGLYILFNTAG